METTSTNKNVIIISIICILSNISYYPVMVQNGLGRKIAIAVWILLGAYVLVCRMPLNTNNTSNLYMILYAIFCFSTIVVGYIHEVNAFTSYHFFQPITIATVVFILANMLGREINREGINKICTVYFYSMAVLSIPLFFIYLRGTDLSTSAYEYQYGKNEISVLLLCALIISCFVYKPKTTAQQLLRIIAVAFFLIDIILLRGRAVFLGVGLLVCVLISKYNTNKKLRYFSIAIVIVISLYFYVHSDVYYMFLNRVIYAGRDANNINELSSGRSEKIAVGFSAFLDNPLFGFGKMGTLDCFYVSVLLSYGLMGIPAIIMAIIPFIWSIRNIRNHNDIDLCFFTIAGSIFIISVLEELAPFGPGTRCYILWLLWGLLLVNDDKRIKSLPNRPKSRYIRNM